MAKRFITPFAEAGDRAAMPDAPTGTDSNYQTGYPSQYEEDPVVNPTTARFVERDKSNQLYNDITANIKEWQEHVYPEFITATNNGGVPFSYKKGSIVTYLDNDYISLVDNNTDVPTAESWRPYNPEHGDVLGFDTLDDAISSNKIRDGDTLNIKERTAGNGGGAMWDVVPSITVTANGYDIVGHNILGLALILRVDGYANVKKMGAIGDGVTDDANVIHFVCEKYIGVIFPKGIYAHAVTLKPVDRNGQKLVFEEGAVLQHTGIGVGVQFGRDDQSARYDCKFINPTINGNSNTTDGLLWQSLSHCYTETINVRNCSGSGVRILWGVDNLFNGYNISSNEGVFDVTPTYGVRIGRTIPGNYSVGNIFLNAVLEGISSDGIYIEEGNNNQFIGGTSEVNGGGYTVSALSFGNEFKNLWCEGNTNYDVNDLGVGTVIDNCYNGSNSPIQPNVTANGSGLIITKGWCRHLELAIAGKDTRLNDVRFSDNPSIGIQGTGAKQIRGCLKADANGVVTGSYQNETGTSGTFTPTLQGGAVAGVHTYSQQSGNWFREGNTVHYNIDLGIATKDSAMTGGVIIGPFPFQAATLGQSQSAIVGYHSSISTVGGRDNITAEMLDSNVYLQLWACQAGASATVVDAAGIIDGSRIKISGFYVVQ